VFQKDWVSWWNHLGEFKCFVWDEKWISAPKPRTYHPDQPLDRLPVLVAVVRERDLVVLVVLFAEVQLHAGALEDALGLARGVVD
jgi:hypothetical protein